MRNEKWFDRGFDFALPLTRFPGLLERLRGTPARLEERVRAIPSEVMTRAHEGRWSAQENVGHLLDLEPLWLTRARQIFDGSTELAPTDLANSRTTNANHNARSLEAILRDFREARGTLVKQLESADDAALTRTALHPRLRKPMRLIDLAEFVAEHDDHHFAVITELTR